MPALQSYIRKAQLSDIPEIENLVNNAYRGDYSRKGWTTEADLLGGIRTDSEKIGELIADKNSIILVFLQNGTIQGCVNLISENEILYLGMLTVNPILQNSGIGKKILRYVEDYAIEKNFASIEMTVISKRQELISWYERKGFQLTGEKRPFPANDPRYGIPKTDLEFVVLHKTIY